MKDLMISVKKILGTCTSTPPLEKGDFFTIEKGEIRIPEGGFMCIWALQNILPLIPAKERKICEKRDEDWMWRVHHVQCPDPNGRVVFEIEQITSGNRSRRKEKKAERNSRKTDGDGTSSSTTKDLRIVVDEVKGKCTSGMKVGDDFLLQGCRLSIPPGRHICLYALQAVLPFLAAKQRRLEDGDWLKEDDRFICPDPAGNVILRIEVLPSSR